MPQALLERDVTTRPLLPVDGHLPVRAVRPDALGPAPEDVRGRWLDRLHRVAVLAGIDLQEVLA